MGGARCSGEESEEAAPRVPKGLVLQSRHLRTRSVPFTSRSLPSSGGAGPVGRHDG